MVDSRVDLEEFAHVDHAPDGELGGALYFERFGLNTLVPVFYTGKDDIFFVGEILVKCAFGDSDGVGNVVHRNMFAPILSKQHLCRIDNFFFNVFHNNILRRCSFFLSTTNGLQRYKENRKRFKSF